MVSFGGGGAVAELGNFCDAASAADIQGFFAAHRAPAAERAVQHSLESIRDCVELRGRLQEALHEWLTARAARQGCAPSRDPWAAQRQAIIGLDYNRPVVLFCADDSTTGRS